MPAACYWGCRRLLGLVHCSVHPGLPTHSCTWPRQQGRARGGGGGADVRSLHGRTRRPPCRGPPQIPRGHTPASWAFSTCCAPSVRGPAETLPAAARVPLPARVPGDSARPGRPRAWLPSFTLFRVTLPSRPRGLALNGGGGLHADVPVLCCGAERPPRPSCLHRVDIWGPSGAPACLDTEGAWCAAGTRAGSHAPPVTPVGPAQHTDFMGELPCGVEYPQARVSLPAQRPRGWGAPYRPSGHWGC